MTKPKATELIDLTEDVNIDHRKVKKGMVLTFDFEGSKTSFKVVKVGRGHNGKILAKEIKLYTEEDFEQKVGEIKPEDWVRKS